MKQKELSILLRAVVALCAAVALFFAYAVGITALKSIFIDQNWQSYYLVLFATMFIPLFLSMWDLWKIFSEIGRDNSFCMENALRLRRISFYALIDTALVLVSTVFMLAVRAMDLFDGLFLFKLFLMIVGVAVAVACAALSHLTRKAALLKDENDLTI